MKFISTLFVLSIFTSSLVFGQLNAVMINDSSRVWGDASSSDIVKDDVFLNNLGSTTMSLRWLRTETLPTGWETLVCDAESCKGPTDDSADYTQPVGEGLLIVHFVPHGITGDGSISLKIKSTESGDFITSTYFAKVSPVGLIDIKMSTQLSVFPNPVQDDIKFANISNYNLASIEIYDLLGQKVMSFPATKTRSNYSVSGLDQGMYFVRLLDKNKRTLVTRKFSKN